MSNSESNRHFASVKWFSNKKGFGFLTDIDSNEDIFVHYSGIDTPDGIYKTLIEGEYVEYNVSPTELDGKKTAQNVTGLRKGLLLCQNPTKRVHLSMRQDLETDSDNGDRQKGGKGKGKGKGSGKGGRGRDNRYDRNTDEKTNNNMSSDNHFSELE